MPYIKTVGISAFDHAGFLSTVDMPNVQKIDKSAFKYTGITYLSYKTTYIDEDGEEKEVELGDSPFYLSPTVRGTTMNNCKTENGYKICGTCDDYVKSGTGCVNDCGSGYLGKEGKCIDSALGCGTNYKDMGGFCNRVRYTPAEAAEIAKDDGNVVTITFKK